MATNRILSNAKEFIKSLDDTEKMLHQRAMEGIAGWMDEVRHVAVDKFMIPNKYRNITIIKKNEKSGDIEAHYKSTQQTDPYRPWYWGKLRPISWRQKTDFDRLTIRTGYLASVVKSDGYWKANRDWSEYKWISRYKSKIKGEGLDPGESVLLWVRPQKNGYMTRFTFGKGNYGKPLQYRLNRAKERPFLQPAIKATENRFDVTVWRRLKLAANRIV